MTTRLRDLAAGLPILLLVAGAAHEAAQPSAKVSGTVRIEAAEAASRPVPTRYQRGRPTPPGAASAPGAVTDVVVWLQPVGHTLAARVPAEHPTLDQKDQAFVPHVLPILVGTTVDITNQDGIYHNVFSLSAPKKFDIGRRPTGERVPIDFSKPGVIRVFCDIHSTMTAFIVVLESPLFTNPGSDGRFEIPGVPPGRYRAQVWHDQYEAEPQEVEVPAGGELRVDFVLK